MIISYIISYTEIFNVNFEQKNAGLEIFNFSRKQIRNFWPVIFKNHEGLLLLILELDKLRVIYYKI